MAATVPLPAVLVPDDEEERRAFFVSYQQEGSAVADGDADFEATAPESIRYVSDGECEENAADDFHSLGSGASTLYFDDNDDDDHDLGVDASIVGEEEEPAGHTHCPPSSQLGNRPSDRRTEPVADVPLSTTSSQVSVPSNVVASSHQAMFPVTIFSNTRLGGSRTRTTADVVPDEVPLSARSNVPSSNLVVSPTTSVQHDEDDDGDSFWSAGFDGSIQLLGDDNSLDSGDAWDQLPPQGVPHNNLEHQPVDVVMASPLLPLPSHDTSTPSANRDQLVVGSLVRIVGGKSPHVGKTGRVDKIGAARVTVTLTLDGALTKRCFGPTNLQVCDVGAERPPPAQSTSSVDAEAESTTPSENGNQSAPRYVMNDAPSSASINLGRDSMQQQHDNILQQPQASLWRSPDANLLLHTRLGLPVDFVRLVGPGRQCQIRSTFAHHVFGDRLVLYKADINQNWQNIPSDFVEPDGRRYQILVSKLHKRTSEWGGGQGFTKLELAVAYVLVSGPDLVTLDLQHELNLIAGFGRLSPEKAAARLELFLSTSCSSNRKGRSHLIFDDVNVNDLEIVPDELVGGDMGCGFVPRRFIEMFLGKWAVGKRTIAIQVRIFAPKYGIFKGMLVEKVGIDKIQLTPSMQKVGPSEHAVSFDPRSCVLITGVFPGKTNYQVAKAFRGEEIGQRITPPTKMSDMALSLLEAHGVPHNLLQKYKKDSYGDWKTSLRHAFLVGVADPSGAIPNGHVFITGLDNIPDLEGRVFLTRFPCTTPSDGLFLPIIKSKPASMSMAAWEVLKRHPLGSIVFGNPLPGQPAIPAMIGGDLDGDLYLTMWQPEILSHIRTPDTLAVVDTVDGSDNGSLYSSPPRPWNPDWLSDAQDVIASIETLAGHHRLIGALFAIRKKAIRGHGYNSPDAVAWGVAYKDAIDIGKHGGLVRLPRCLWDLLDASLHRFLCDANGDNINTM